MILCASCHVNGVAMLCLKATEDSRVPVIAHSIAEGLQIELLSLYHIHSYPLAFLLFPLMLIGNACAYVLVWSAVTRCPTFFFPRVFGHASCRCCKPCSWSDSWMERCRSVSLEKTYKAEGGGQFLMRRSLTLLMLKISRMKFGAFHPSLSTWFSAVVVVKSSGLALQISCWWCKWRWFLILFFICLVRRNL